jgi:hypothetical protein
MRKSLLCTALAAFVSGCGGGGASPGLQAADAASAADGGGGASLDLHPITDGAGTPETAGGTSTYCTSKPALASVKDLSGIWVVRMVGSQVVSPGFVSPYSTQSIFYLLLTINQTGTDVVADGRYCDRTEIDPPNSMAPVKIPAAWAHTEKAVHRTGTFAPGSDGTSVLSFSPKVEVAGAILDPAAPTLPTSATELGVVDEDGDGHPGITVTLNGALASGSLYVVQEQTTSVLAIAVAPDRVEGTLAFSSIQNVLGSNPASLSDPKTLVGAAVTKPGTTHPDPTLCNSSFAMVKIADVPGSAGVADGGAVGCEWVRENEDRLFSQ